MWAVIVSVLVTSPFLTALSIAIPPPAVKGMAADTFISDLARFRGGYWLEISVVSSAAALLLFAANTA